MGMTVDTTRFGEIAVDENDIITFDEPHLAPPGQSLVLYENDMLVGGGVIAP